MESNMSYRNEEQDRAETTAKGWARMQASYVTIKKKVMTEGASINLHALCLWTYNQPECKAYYGTSPWLLRKQIEMAVGEYASDCEAEVISFNNGDAPI